jgi:hypothetical protein
VLSNDRLPGRIDAVIITDKDIGIGEVGGKAAGLLAVMDALVEHPVEATMLPMSVPEFAVIRTDLFDRFMKSNGLWEDDVLNQSDRLIAHAFQQADLPVELVGSLWQFARTANTPWAVRSSSLLEDSLGRPFAGIYQTKMIACYEAGDSARFQRLTEAVKLVYASTFFQAARAYRETIGVDHHDEKMAVVLQPVVGTRHGHRFYPTLSGVIRSVNYYPFGHGTPEDGTVSLALGLGKTIVDGGQVWQYCPRYPAAPPPVSGVSDVLSKSQRLFWAVRMGLPPVVDPTMEDEHLVQLELDEAHYDGELDSLISHYNGASDRLSPGPGSGDEPVALTFSPLLEYGLAPFNDSIVALEALCRTAIGAPVEVEFAASRQSGEFSISILQARPLVVSEQLVSVSEEQLEEPENVVVCRRSLGNGEWRNINNVVYLKPDVFAPAKNPVIRQEVAEINNLLQGNNDSYLLIGYGRWGSQDPWLGVPVTWGEIGAAAAIVEAVRDDWRVDLSQGSHFFHNLTSFGVPYLCLDPLRDKVDWDWLSKQPVRLDRPHVRCVQLKRPLHIKVDGRYGRGVVTR